MNKYAILIGIAGGTGSGKTSIAKAIAADFGKSEVALIEQDSYYKNLSNIIIEERSLVKLSIFFASTEILASLLTCLILSLSIDI